MEQKALRESSRKLVEAIEWGDIEAISKIKHQYERTLKDMSSHGNVDETEKLLVRTIPHIVTSPSKLGGELTERTARWLFNRTKRRHLVFLRGLQQTGLQIGKMNDTLERIFGQGMTDKDHNVLRELRSIDNPTED